MIHLPQSKPTLLVASLALAMAAPSDQAHALALSASATWSLNGVPGATSPHTDTSTPVADVLNGDSSGQNNVFYHVGGDQYGNYSSRVSGEGVFDITGHWKSTFNFTNTLGGPASFTYGLNIENGELQVGMPGDNIGSGLAKFMLTLSLDGTQIAFSSGELGTATAYLPVLAGFDLGGTTSPGLYSWSSSTKSFGLGTFAAGESFTIDVDLVTHASRDLLSDTCGSSGYGAGIATFAVGGGEGGVCGATARFGDPPFVIGQPGGGGLTGQLNPVPEPGTLALLGVGLASAAGLRRRKRR